MKVEGLRQATNGVIAYRNLFEREALGAFREGSRQVTKYDKQNRQWIDRTHQAKIKIKCKAYREGNSIFMDNGHYATNPEDGFSYGISLEGEANNALKGVRKYAILQTALRRWWAWTIQRFADRLAGAA